MHVCVDDTIHYVSEPVLFSVFTGFGTRSVFERTELGHKLIVVCSELDNVVFIQ